MQATKELSSKQSASAPSEDAAEQKIQLLSKHFFARTDTCAILAPWKKPCPAQPDDLEVAIRAHVQGPGSPIATFNCHLRGRTKTESGHFRIGSYSLAPDNTVRWLCGDVDGPNHGKSGVTYTALSGQHCPSGTHSFPGSAAFWRLRHLRSPPDHSEPSRVDLPTPSKTAYRESLSVAGDPLYLSAERQCRQSAVDLDPMYVWHKDCWLTLAPPDLLCDHGRRQICVQIITALWSAGTSRSRQHRHV